MSRNRKERRNAAPPIGRVHPARPLPKSDRERILRRLRRLAYWLDNAVYIPVLNYRVGYDAIIGLIPGVGDAVTLIPEAYIIYESYRLGVPRRTLVQMMGNVGLELVVGVVPVFGDLFDATYKANTRNLVLLERHVGPLGSTPLPRPSNRRLILFLLGALFLLVGVAVLLIWAAVMLLGLLFGALPTFG